MAGMKLTKTLALVAALAPGMACSALQEDACVRSTPAPLFSYSGSGVTPQAFTLVSSHEALEQFQLSPRIQVKVEHGGCEYVVVKLRFESTDLFAQGYTDALAHDRAVALLRLLQYARPALSLDLNLAGTALLRAGAREPSLRQEWVFQGRSGEPLAATVRLDAAGRSGSLGYVELTLAQGPL